MSQPFIPLVGEEAKPYEIKNVLQKQIKLLTPEEYHFFSFLIATNHLFEQLTHYQNKLNSDPQFSLWKLFEFFDTNGDRKLQLDDFILTLQKLDIMLKREEVESLFNSLGGEDDHIISYAEFAFLLKFTTTPEWRQAKKIQDGVLSQEQQKLIHQIFSLYAKLERSLLYLQSQIGNDIGYLQELFRMLDEKQNGYITFNDLITYLKAKGVQVKGNDFSRVFFMLQQHKSGRVNFDEFLRKFSTKQAYKNHLIQKDLLLHPPQEAPREVPQEIQQLEQQRISEQQKQPILNHYLSIDSRQSNLNQTDDSIRLPGFTRYVFQDNQY